MARAACSKRQCPALRTRRKRRHSTRTAQTANALIVVGNESEGLPQEWVDTCDLKCTLNMPGNTESLNAAIAGSIVLYLARGA